MQGNALTKVNAKVLSVIISFIFHSIFSRKSIRLTVPLNNLTSLHIKLL